MSGYTFRETLLQNRREHDEFLDILRADGARSYMEIGSMFGGSLWRVAHALPKGSRVVSVDYAVDRPDARPELDACIGELRREGYDAHLVDGDSMATATVAATAALGPFDCVFIDGAHTLEAVSADWQNYGPMGRIVAFHDISWNETWKSAVPGRVSKPMGVPALWDQVKTGYRHVALQYQEPRNYYGIGVLWRE